MKKIIALFTSILMVLSFVACGKSDKDSSNEKTEPSNSNSETSADAEEEENKPVTITYCNFNSSGGHEDTLKAMYDEFHKQYPYITVDIQTIGYNDYFTQMQTKVAGGTAPDCYELNIENFASYAKKGVLGEIENIDESAFNKTALNAFNIDGKQYGVPGCFSNVILIYNKDLFDKAEVSYPTNDWTWDDAQKAAEAIRALDKNTYGIYAPITYNEFFKVCAQFGGSLLNEDKTKFTVNSKENIAAAQMMIDRVNKSNVQPNDEQLGGMGDWDLFESGRLGMIPTGIWAFSTFKDACDFDWDIVVEPGAKNKATHFFSNALVINNDSDNKEAASKWITWLASSPEASKLRIDSGWDLPAISDETVLNTYLSKGSPENRQAVFDSLNYLTTPSVIEDYTMMSDIISKYLSLAANGSISAEKAMNDAQKELTEKIKLN